jgi:hypothetical protein
MEAGLPELDVARVRRWCELRVPEHVRHQIKVECDVGPRHLTIVECRPPWRKDMGPGVDAVPDRPAALHQGDKAMVPVLA